MQTTRPSFAIVGAGLEVRQVMKVKGPAPVVVLPSQSAAVKVTG